MTSFIIGGMAIGDIIVFFMLAQALFTTMAFLKIWSLERKFEGLTIFVKRFLSGGK